MNRIARVETREQNTVNDFGLPHSGGRLLLSACCFLLVAGGSLPAQTLGVSSPGQFSITAPLAGDQTKPQAAVSSTNGIVVWQDNAVDDRGLRIRAQWLNALYQPVGEPINVSSSKSRKTTGDLENPQVALLPDGSALVVWQGGLGGQQCIYGQVVNPDGTTASKRDRKLTKSRKISQVDPALAMLRDGNIALVYSGNGQDGSMLGIFGQIIDGNGKAVVREFQINQRSQFNQRNPSVAGLSDGRFVVVWVSELQRSSSAGSVDIYGRIFSADGEPLTGDFVVNPALDKLRANPMVAGSPDGGFGIVWSENDQLLAQGVPVVTGGEIGQAVTSVGEFSTNSWDISGLFYDPSGVATTPSPVLLNTHTYGDQYAPRLAASHGGYLAVWMSLAQDGSREGVFGRLLDANGAAASDELAVNSVTVSRQIQPLVAGDGQDRFLTVWTSFGAGTSFDLKARAYLQAGGQ